MLSRQRIFICGQSIFMQAIEANLATRPDIELRRFDSHLPHIVDRLVKQNPDLVILERCHELDKLALDLLRYDQPLLMLDMQQGKTLAFTGQQIHVTAINELNETHIQLDFGQFR